MAKKKRSVQDIVIYQAKNGAIELRGDFSRETLWATLQQIADLFDTDKSGISRHIRNIYDEGELERPATVAKKATVQTEGKREVVRDVEYYNLDLILSVGYRVNSKKATIFRKWATEVLRKHIVEGYTINKKLVAKNYEAFLKAVDEVRALLPESGIVGAEGALGLVRMFAATWLALDAYDRSDLPTSGATRKQVVFTGEELAKALGKLREELAVNGQAGDLFGAERSSGSISGIVGNVFQSFGGKDVYPTLKTFGSDPVLAGSAHGTHAFGRRKQTGRQRADDRIGAAPIAAINLLS